MITQRQDKAAVRHEESTPQAGKDEATLSLDRDSISTMTSQAMTTAPTRQEKIEALRQAVSSGEYKVEPEKIAEAMLDAALKQ